MAGEIAIRAAGLGKRYNVYPTPIARVKQAFYPRLQRLLPGFVNRMLPWDAHPVKLYQEFWSLRGVDFEVAKGETVGIVGRNGSGKSTLLQLACGILTPTEGTVEAHGRTAALLELGAGFNPEFSGRDNVFVNAAVLGLKRHETEERLDRIVAFAELGDFIDRPVRTYSSGMYVRLAFSVAVHVDPEVLVIDEALAVGDAAFQLKCIERMNEIRDRGTTILFVSHSAEQVKRFCDRALWLDRGRLRAIGPSALVADEYRDFSASSEAEGAHHAVHGTAPHQELASIVRVECERRELATFETARGQGHVSRPAVTAAEAAPRGGPLRPVGELRFRSEHASRRRRQFPTRRASTRWSTACRGSRSCREPTTCMWVSSPTAGSSCSTIVATS